MPSPLANGAKVTVELWRDPPETLHMRALAADGTVLGEVSGGTFRDMVTYLLIAVDPETAVEMGVNPRVVLAKVLERENT